MYHNMKGEVIKVMEGAESYGSLVLDFWTNETTGKSFGSVSMAILQKDALNMWRIHMPNMCVVRLKSPHTAVRICEWLRLVLVDFGYTGALEPSNLPIICTATVDNGANLVKAVEDMGYLFIPCFAHTVSLVISDVLKSREDTFGNDGELHILIHYYATILIFSYIIRNHSAT